MLNSKWDIPLKLLGAIGFIMKIVSKYVNLIGDISKRSLRNITNDYRPQIILKLISWNCLKGFVISQISYVISDKSYMISDRSSVIIYMIKVLWYLIKVLR